MRTVEIHHKQETNKDKLHAEFELEMQATINSMHKEISYHSLMKQKNVCTNSEKLLLMALANDSFVRNTLTRNMNFDITNERALGVGFHRFSASAPRASQRAFFTGPFEDMGMIKDAALVLLATFKGWKTKFQDMSPMKKHMLLLGLTSMSLHLALHYKMKSLENNHKKDYDKARAEFKLEMKAAVNAMLKEISSEVAKSAQVRADSMAAIAKCKAH